MPPKDQILDTLFQVSSTERTEVRCLLTYLQSLGTTYSWLKLLNGFLRAIKELNQKSFKASTYVVAAKQAQKYVSRSINLSTYGSR